MIRHVVLLRWAPGATDEQHEAVLEARVLQPGVSQRFELGGVGLYGVQLGDAGQNAA